MKYCLLLICITLTLSVSAQFDFRFYTQGGANYSTIRIPKTTGIETSNGGYGWQLGIGTEYHTKFGHFIYLSAGGRNETFSKDSTTSHRPDTVAQFKYSPLFVTLPVGIGWQCPLTKKMDLKVYGGLDIQIGVAGKVKRRDLYYTRDSITQQPVLARSSTDKDRKST